MLQPTDYTTTTETTGDTPSTELTGETSITGTIGETPINDYLVQKASRYGGVGLFTTRPIPRGYVVLVDYLLFHVQSSKTTWAIPVVEEYLKLHYVNRIAYLDLTYNGDKIPPAFRYNECLVVQAIFFANACSIGPDRYGIFLQYSRLNHSCTPNVATIFHKSTRLIYVRAARDLFEGEEVLVA
ncbi:hypothetical protein F5Y12DRAFT_792172 [Xylaria sp. FL1777]|nr:hypothetical protein F5Y12DRAFT_792172 [Xylaria sp. FL1777]